MGQNNDCIAIDVGGTNIRAARVVAGIKVGEILFRDTPDNIFDFKRIVWEVMRELDLGDQTLVGITVPGVVDYNTKQVSACPNLQYLNGLNNQNILDRDLVSIGNDADMALRGELVLGKLFESDLALITLGTGIGSAYYVEGVGPWNSNLSCELGHSKIISGTDMCTCGEIGCLETFFSGWALLKKALSEDLDVKNTEDFFILAEQKNQTALSILDESAKYLSIAMANFINITGINKIILGGKIAQSVDLFLPKIIQLLQTNVYLYHQRNIDIAASEYIDIAPLIGVADFSKKSFNA